MFDILLKVGQECCQKDLKIRGTGGDNFRQRSDVIDSQTNPQRSVKGIDRPIWTYLGRLQW